MLNTKISPELQVRVPQKNHNLMNIESRKSTSVIHDQQNFIQHKVSDLEGFLKGIDTTFIREDDRA
mgnify:CR=1 FL=1